jgi:hypothetical protein
MGEPNPERAVGRVEGKLDLLIAQVHEQKEEERQGRARIYTELEQLRVQAAESRRDTAELKGKMAEATPVIADIKKWRERFIGMQMLIGFLGVSVGGAIVAFWKWIMAKLGMQ